MTDQVERLKLKHTRSRPSLLAQQLNIGEGSACWVQINGARLSIRRRLEGLLRQLVPDATAVAAHTRARLERKHKLSQLSESELRELLRGVHRLWHTRLPVAAELVAEVERQVDSLLRRELARVVQQLHEWVKEAMRQPVLEAFAAYYGAGDTSWHEFIQGIVEPELHRQLDRLLPYYIKMSLAQGKRCVHGRESACLS